MHACEIFVNSTIIGLWEHVNMKKIKLLFSLSCMYYIYEREREGGEGRERQEERKMRGGGGRRGRESINNILYFSSEKNRYGICNIHQVPIYRYDYRTIYTIRCFQKFCNIYSFSRRIEVLNER